MISLSALARQLGVPAWRIDMEMRCLDIPRQMGRDLMPAIDEGDADAVRAAIVGGGLPSHS